MYRVVPRPQPVADFADRAERNRDAVHRIAERLLLARPIDEPRRCAEAADRGELLPAARDVRLPDGSGLPDHHQGLHAGVFRGYERFAEIDDRRDLRGFQDGRSQTPRAREEHPGVRDQQRDDAARPDQLERAQDERGVPIDLPTLQRRKPPREPGVAYVAVGRIADDEVGRFDFQPQRIAASQTRLRHYLPRHAQRRRVEIDPAQIGEARARHGEQERTRPGARVENGPAAPVPQRKLDDERRQLGRRVVQPRLPAEGISERARFLFLEGLDERIGAQRLPRGNVFLFCSSSVAISSGGSGCAPPSARAW